MGFDENAFFFGNVEPTCEVISESTTIIFIYRPIITASSLDINIINKIKSVYFRHRIHTSMNNVNTMSIQYNYNTAYVKLCNALNQN